jgi:hypothetical protein
MNPRRQFLVFLTAVVGFVLLLVLIFGRGSNNRSSGTEVKKEFSLLDYANRDSKVIAIIDGPITGDDTHRAIRFTISPETRLAEVVQGYEGNVIKSQSQVNNPSAYRNFIYALSKAGFGRERKTDLKSEQGVCATGRRFVFEVYDNNDRVSRTWTAGCIKGSSPADPSTASNLFIAQVTDYNSFASGVWRY